MDDKELLELAAKAAGYKLHHYVNDVHHFEHLKLMTDAHWSQWKEWNPIADDGDALRLAVKLGLCIERTNSLTDGSGCTKVRISDYSKSYLSGPHYVEEDVRSAGSYAATRRAITRAAAEIGKAMQ